MSEDRRSPARQLVKRALATVVPLAGFLEHGPRDGRVCLTFDDGPHPEHTPRLLDLLAELELRASFFVVGERAALHPALVRRVVDEGHLLGGHTYTHGEPSTTSARALGREVRRTGALLRDLVGRVPTHFRPPHGKLTGSKLLGLWLQRQSVVLWNVDPKDFSRRDAGEVASFFAARPLEGGDLVLLHDSVAHAAIALPAVIAVARQRGLGFATVDAWTGRGAWR